MAPRTRSKCAPASEEAEANDAAAISTTSPTHNIDFEEIPERPSKWARITHETEVRDLATRTDASRQAVLQTNELLEGILMFLPPKQLFVGQRVCKQWRDVIASSPELQRKMFLRVDEVPRQTWGVKVNYHTEDPSARLEVRKFDDSPLSWPWKRVTPAVLSPHLTIEHVGDEGLMGTRHGDRVTFQLPCSLPVGRRISILDTYFSNLSCYDFEINLVFTFEPVIPGYDYLFAEPVEFKTGKALKVGEALEKAMIIRTYAKLCLHMDGREKSIKTKVFQNITMTEIINKLQRKYGCTAILCESSTIFLGNVVVPNEQQRVEVDATYARTIQRTE